jgi:hypothetical protein
VHNIFLKLISLPKKDMPNAQSLFNEYMQSLEATLSTETDLLQYEEQFSKLHREFGRKLLEQRLSKAAEEEKKEYKKTLYKFWSNSNRRCTQVRCGIKQRF